MTVSHESDVQESDLFAPLYPHAFISLTTFRKSGEAVPTTVWFAPDEQGRIYVTTQASAGKLKRLRHTPGVQMTPCGKLGELLDKQTVIGGYARELTRDEFNQAEAALIKKYRDAFTNTLARMGEEQKASRTYIKIVAKEQDLA